LIANDAKYHIEKVRHGSDKIANSMTPKIATFENFRLPLAQTQLESKGADITQM
jgi:hypothetical protein